MKKHYYLLFTILIASLSFGQIASDDFTYSDGSLVGNGAWVTHSGTAGDLLVSSGQVVVQHGTPSEDANLPFTPVSGVLYFGIDFTVDSSSDIPGSDNEYFAHFKDSGNGFRARLDVVPGTAGGNYTVGISSSTSTAQATWGTDLSFGVTYRAIAKYDQDNGLAELWIDASSSGDTSISGNTATATSIESFALRQSDSDNNETITVDNLVVGQTFAEALGASSTTESIPWSDDLEGDLSEFTTYQASSGTGMWAITTSRYHSGAQSVYHSDATGDHDSWLLTPTFDLSGATAPELIYWDNENYYTYYVNHEVLVSEDYTDDVAAATWVELADGVSDEDTWVERGPLALPTTGTVTVAFRYEGNYADAWYLDDISVAEAPVTYESIPWSDDFETGDFSAGWTSSEAAGAPTSLWEVSNLANNTSGGAYSARHNYSTAGTFDSYLVGPTFDLSGASSPAVSYSDFVDWSGDADVHSLVYSEDYTDDVDAATWVVLNDVLGSEDTWVANGPYALPTSGTVTIAFRYQGYYAAEWFIDDVNVEEDTMSIDDEDILDMRIYPNPVDGNFVTILSPVNGTKYIQVFDINGRRVMDTSINNNMLDVSSINSGFYMIKVTIDGQSKISKLVVR